MPILDGFRRQNRSKEQRARLEIQEIRERDLTNQVETEARQAVLDLSSAEQQVVIARDRMRLAERELSEAAGAVPGRGRRQRRNHQRTELGHRGARRA